MFGFIFDFIAMLDWFLCIYIAAYVFVFSAKDCIIIFIFIIVWHLYRLAFLKYIYFLYCMCVFVCCSSNDCYFCECVIAVFAFALESFFFFFWQFVVATLKATHRKKSKTFSQVFCSVVSVFCLVRGSCMLSSCAVFCYFLLFQNPNQTNEI